MICQDSLDVSIAVVGADMFKFGGSCLFVDVR
jgi:hypothetical protein